MQTFVPTLVLALGAGSSLVYAVAELGEGRACKAQAECAPAACGSVVVAPVPPVHAVTPVAPCEPSLAPRAPHAPHAPRAPRVEPPVAGSVVWGHTPGPAPSEPGEPVEPQDHGETCAALARIEAGLAELQRAVRELDLSALEIDAEAYAEAARAWAPLAVEGAEDLMASLANLEVLEELDQLENLEDLEYLEELGGLEGLQELVQVYGMEACASDSDCEHECCQDGAEAQAMGAWGADVARKALEDAYQAVGRAGGASGDGTAELAQALELAQQYGAASAAYAGDDELRGLLGELRTEVGSLREAVRDLRTQVEALSRLRETGQVSRPAPGPTAYTPPSWNLTQPTGGAR
jgi:hypothetical protein